MPTAEGDFAKFLAGSDPGKTRVARDRHGGWGLITTSAVPAGTELFRVRPRHTLRVGAHPMADRLTAAGCSRRGALAAYLLTERLLGAESQLAGWMALWPSGVIGFLGLSAEELEDRAGDRELVTAWRRAEQAVRADYAAARAAVGEQDGFGWEGFLWATGIVNSRAVTTTSTGTQLIALLDFANHQPSLPEQVAGR